MAANYSADIRIGITGKAGLNNLEKQLKRVNAQVNKLNKALVLKTRAQTIKLNTKGATAAIKQLEDRINKLGRTVQVNVRTNESRTRQETSSSSGGNVFLSNNQATQGLAIAKATAPIAKALTNESQKQLDLEAEKNRQVERLLKGKEDIATSEKEISRLQSQQAKLQKSTNNRSAAAMFGAGTTREQGLERVTEA